MTEPAGSERRQHARRALRTVAQVMASAGGALQVRTSDVSAGGVGLVMDLNPPIGLTFQVSLVLPLREGGGRPFECKAQVMRSIYGQKEGGFVVGLRFTSMEPASEELLKRFLSQFG